MTHLPQVAACADHHLLVAKRQVRMADGEDARTESGVAALADDRRVHEIARMLGGERVSPTSLAHAREMLGSQDAKTP